ncbi:MAG: hypothetical protein IJ037_09475 [Clostridia bacterium]|nr:hypothetical protein [Clostridia bacterium]MBQ8369632.1 hypothetical protein [Clostridia bacterium]MBQ8513666.1 hypothetical protein [Clostridia bacterium]
MSEELLQYKCPNCGGQVEFNSQTQNMKCPYCDSEFAVESLHAMDESLQDEKPDDMQWNTGSSSEWTDSDTEGMRSYLCQSCGGEIVCDEHTAASACPYCGNPVVMTGNLAGTLKPDLVIPFKIDKKAAKEALKRHTTGKKLLPKIFSDENHLEEIQGIYVPFWLFDADADVQLRFKGTKNRIWSDHNYNYTETQFYSVQRGGSMSFAAVPVDSSAKMPDDLMESIEPYDMKDAVDFRTAYLSGYLAEKYGSTADECIPRANERVKKTAQAVFQSQAQGYTTLIPEQTNVQLRNGTVKYVLLPVWILHTKWNDETYTFAMNGQTGKFVGNLPMDKSAYWKWRLGLTAAFGAAIYLLMQFMF